ncbi:MAG: bifunctional phosphoribosyl-AMP cyclohydrolase/phosphoribosyl-ATP diphosphatase HisIE [Bacillota bacterium]
MIFAKLEKDFIDQLQFDERGLVPTIVQELNSGQVLMLAYQNREALLKTLETGNTWFYSRSRQELWHKGATSGHYQQVHSIYYDCDGDTILIIVKQRGVACHKGYYSCFHHQVTDEGILTNQEAPLISGSQQLGQILGELSEIIGERKENLPEGSYTTYLFEQGLDKILKKVGEEAAEIIIAAKNPDQGELIYETADFLYHLLVLLTEKELSLKKIAQELAKRRK